MVADLGDPRVGFLLADPSQWRGNGLKRPPLVPYERGRSGLPFRPFSMPQVGSRVRRSADSGTAIIRLWADSVSMVGVLSSGNHIYCDNCETYIDLLLQRND